MICRFGHEDEHWRDVVGFEGLYRVSSFGRIKSYNRDSIRGRLMKLCTNERGYKVVYLRDWHGNRKRLKVHRIAVEAFFHPVGPFEVDHIDRNRANNHIDNLRITTRSENLARRVFGNPDQHFDDALRMTLTAFEDPSYKNN